MPVSLFKQYANGFTLAELLVSLAILGVIATFTIPKIITAQQAGNNMAAAKEAIATVSGALQSYQRNYTLSDSTTFGALTPFMNYVTADTGSTIVNELLRRNSLPEALLRRHAAL